MFGYYFARQSVSVIRKLITVCAVFAVCTVSPLYAEPPNLMLLKKDIVLYHDSGAYAREFEQVVENARGFIHQQVKKNALRAQQKPLALVLDIDETSLSNYPFIVARDFSAKKEQISKEIQAAKAPALPAMLTLYQEAIQQGVAVFFVTGRHQSELAVTKKNLARAGYQGYKGIYVRPEQYEKDSIIPFKANARRQIEKQGYLIIANMGDQYSDLIGGHALKGFKLPNPYYFLP